MPRKAKELLEEENSSSKKTSVKEKTSTLKKNVIKKEPVSKKKEVVKKKTSSKKHSNAKKTENKVVTSKKDLTKNVTKSSTKETSKKTNSSKKETSTPVKKTRAASRTINMLEYYDLPSRYSQTVVKILAQTPKMLFVYWDISEEDKNNYISQYGEDFFNNTVPFLRIKNQTENYTFEVDVDDFANSWYLPVNNAKSTYSIELLRKQKPNMNKIIEHDIYIVSSNNLESPNDHILFEKQQKMVYFRNVKNNTLYSKDISTLTFIQNIGKIYNIYDFYKTIYNQENIDEMYDLSNPSSNPSSSSLLDNLS